MTVTLATGSVVATPGQSISLSSIVSVTAGSDDPHYLVVSGLDRNEYTVSATGSTGVFTGNGHTQGYVSIDGSGDGYGAGVVFTYNAATGQYANAAFGNLSDLKLTASTDINRNESISVFTTNDPTGLTQYANDPYSLSQMTDLLGSVSVVTAAAGTVAPATQATPSSIVSAAVSYVGQAWNESGCWVLCSNISAKAGASLPLTSTSVGVAGVNNGEWIVAYNGPAGQTGDWQSLVKAGEMVVFATSATSGHITTVVSGTGASAQLIDNITYVNPNGSIANSAKDGSSQDIIVSAPHLASQEFAQAVAGSVVIYELDTPTVVAAASKPTSVSFGSKVALSDIATATDPGTRAVTKYQIYDIGVMGAVSDTFLVNGVTVSAHSAATAITTSAADMASTFLQAANAIGVDTLMIRAYNGAYWGDWSSESIAILPGAPSTPVSTPVASLPTPPTTPTQTTSSAPHLSAPTGTQVWRSHQAVEFALASNTFTDSNGLGLKYAVHQVSGRALPWLTFNPETLTFSGTSHRRFSTTAEFAVTATNSAGASSTEYFSAKIVASAAQFTHAISALAGSNGASATSALTSTATHAVQTLASPVA